MCFIYDFIHVHQDGTIMLYVLYNMCHWCLCWKTSFYYQVNQVTFITLVTIGNMFLSVNCPLLFVLNLLSPPLCQSWPMCFIMQHLYGKRTWIFLFYIQHEGSKIYAKKVTDNMSREASTNVLQFIAPE